MGENSKLIHQTNNRARFLCDILKHNFNLKSLDDELRSIVGVKSVRINALANSIVFEYEGDATLSSIQSKLDSLDIDKFQVCDTFLSNHATCTPCVGEEKPSKSGMIRATSALVAEPFISNDMTKLAVSTAAALPMLKNGLSELYEEGLTSGVLEAMAVGVSLARKDYMAANGTNAMLELGE
ncbi:MAG TPA: heavy metal translocating P-type ATPase, partial [Campylobacterales bacterium]|nr:heavy metal translocating P-type ATPase [Campylobacterales bacterium]